MTKGSYKEECQQVLKDIEAQHGLKPWYIVGYVDSDDHGPCVVIKVRADMFQREKIRHPNNNVKVCTYLIRK